MSRGFKILLWCVSTLIAILALAVIVLLNFDWNRAKPWINTRVSETIGRPFAINGDLSLRWLREPEAEAGWRGWVPWPRIQARNISVANPDWAHAAPKMAEVGLVAFSVNPLPLLHKQVIIPVLQLDDAAVTLERAADGKQNWIFKTAQASPSGWAVDLKRLQLNKATARLVDAIKHADIKAQIDTLQQSQSSPYGIGWKLSGSFNHQPVSGSGKAGAILSLRDAKTPYPLDAAIHVGKTSIGVKGSLTDPASLAALDLRLHLSGVSMADLYPLTGVLLPDTRPFSTEGHLSGTLNRAGGDWKYEKFSGKMGASDLSGTLEFLSRAPRPLLRGTVVSSQLLFEDLAPLIGADSNASKAARGVAPDQRADKVLPTEPFKVERWRSIDAEVQFTGRKIVRSKELPIDDLFTKLHLQDGVLHLAPLTFGVAGGKLVSDIRLDGRSSNIKADMKIALQSLKLKQLFPTFQPMQTSLGEVNGKASLSATGNSVAALLGASNGELKASISEGSISKLLLEEAGLNLGNVVLTKLFGDKQVKLNCMASDFNVTRGIMQTRTFLIDTEDATITLNGQIDLARENLNLTINPETKGLRVISLRAPLYVTGSFKKPKLNVDKGVLTLKAGSAIALAALAPVLTAILPLVNAGHDIDPECGRLLQAARTKPVAPPPGKTLPDSRAPAAKTR